jgi:hypothetical protein
MVRSSIYQLKPGLDHTQVLHGPSEGSATTIELAWSGDSRSLFILRCAAFQPQLIKGWQLPEGRPLESGTASRRVAQILKLRYRELQPVFDAGSVIVGLAVH